jgi:hypothetical protein
MLSFSSLPAPQPHLITIRKLRKFSLPLPTHPSAPSTVACSANARVAAVVGVWLRKRRAAVAEYGGALPDFPDAPADAPAEGDGSSLGDNGDATASASSASNQGDAATSAAHGGRGAGRGARGGAAARNGRGGRANPSRAGRATNGGRDAAANAAASAASSASTSASASQSSGGSDGRAGNLSAFDDEDDVDDDDGDDDDGVQSPSRASAAAAAAAAAALQKQQAKAAAERKSFGSDAEKAGEVAALEEQLRFALQSASNSIGLTCLDNTRKLNPGRGAGNILTVFSERCTSTPYYSRLLF